MRKKTEGFTLIEVLMVVAIMGILMLAVSRLYVSYRIKTYDASAQSDLKHLAISLENYFEENNSYPLTVPADFKGNGDVTVSVDMADGESFRATARHAASTNTWTYISNQGGLQ